MVNEGKEEDQASTSLVVSPPTRLICNVPRYPATTIAKQV